MPKISVYLSQDLYDRARKESLPLSKLAQEAIEAALHRQANKAWIERMRARPPLEGPGYDITELMDEVRGEFGA